MTAAAGLLLALTCLAIVAAGLGLAITAWQPRTDMSTATTWALTATITIGGSSLLLTALHWLTRLLT